MNDIKLLPCPYCGSDRIDFATSCGGTYIAAHCIGCGAMTRWESTEKKAAKLWNRRKKDKKAG